MRLLLVEDEMKLAKALAHLLHKNGYSVDTAPEGLVGLEMAASGGYDLIVLDRMLPGLDGLSIIKELRGQGLKTAVLFLTAKDAPEDRVEGLDAGADDYLVKPFSIEELLARLRALARRQEKEWVGATIAAAGLSLDPLKCEVTRGDNPAAVKLSVKEALLLELLLRNHGQVVTKERIYERVWGYDSQTDMANIDLYIHYLRKKLGGSCIKTVRGIGFTIKEERDVS